MIRLETIYTQTTKANLVGYICLCTCGFMHMYITTMNKEKCYQLESGRAWEGLERRWQVGCICLLKREVEWG